MWKKIITMSLVGLLLVVILFPLIYLFSHSLKSQALIRGIYCSEEATLWQKVWVQPFNVSLNQYYEVFFRTPKFLYMFWNSLGIVLAIVLGQVSLAFLAGYGFSKLKFPGSNHLFFLYMVIMLMPFQVTVVPNYIMLNRLRLLDTRYALILPGIFNTFSVFFLKQFMEGIDKSFLEEARLLGANEFEILAYVVMPLCKPILVAVIMFVFIDYWSMVEQPIIFIKTESKYPLSVFLNTINASKKEIGFTASVLYMILPIGLVLYAQSDLIEGFRITTLK